MRADSRASRTYELMVILHPEVSEEELPAAIDRVAGYLTAAGGTVNETLRESPWGRRRLAYPIRHGSRDLRDGFYVVYHYDLGPDQVGDVERDLKLDDRVIRYLVTHYVPQPVDPRLLEQQEIDAEEAAAAAYAAAQVAQASAAAAAADEIAEAVEEAEAVVEAAADAEAEAEAESEE